MIKRVIGSCEMYLADYKDVMPDLNLKNFITVTDPPYPDLNYGWAVDMLASFKDRRGFFFWMNMVEFPLPYTAKHIWGKPNVFLGGQPQYETIYEINGGKVCTFYRHTSINNRVSAQMARDVKYDHPCQKPMALMRDIIKRLKCAPVLDPFMGSGTTAQACIEKCIKFIGIEKDPVYFEMACERIKNTQEELDAQLQAFRENGNPKKHKEGKCSE